MSSPQDKTKDSPSPGTTRQLASLLERKRKIELLLQRQLQKTARLRPPPASINYVFSPERLAETRKRLGLSASQCGRLLTVSYQTVINWESGVEPHTRNLPGLAEFESMTVEEASDRILALKTTSAKAKRRSRLKETFDPELLAAARKRLLLSASQCGRLLGITYQSFLSWETGRRRPHPSNYPALEEFRTMTKQDVERRLKVQKEKADLQNKRSARPALARASKGSDSKQSRQSFERFLKRRHYDLSKLDAAKEGHYLDPQTQLLWEVWHRKSSGPATPTSLRRVVNSSQTTS